MTNLRDLTAAILAEITERFSVKLLRMVREPDTTVPPAGLPRDTHPRGLLARLDRHEELWRLSPRMTALQDRFLNEKLEQLLHWSYLQFMLVLPSSSWSTSGRS